MRRKFISVAAFIAITVAIWIYWSSNAEFNNTIIILKRKNVIVKDTVIEPPTCKDSISLLILVTSYVGHVELRSAHRRAMPADLLAKLNITRVFLVAKIPEKDKYISQQAIIDESNTFEDILQGSFVEHYRNLTYKHLMGLHWASMKCSQSVFILKVDDDIVFNLERTHEFLNNLDNTDNLLMGYILNGSKPKRNNENKWYVTWDEYPRNEYPPYLSGWYYITTPKIAAKLADEAIYHPYFWIDDIFVTGILTESLGIKLQQLPKDYWMEYYELLECCLIDMIKKFNRCDHVVGPNGGRNNLIFEFNEAFTNCNKWANCTKRTNQTLNKNCVVYKERNIFSDGGLAEVHSIKL